MEKSQIASDAGRVSFADVLKRRMKPEYWDRNFGTKYLIGSELSAQVTVTLLHIPVDSLVHL
jgi:hypothetical protein